MVEEDIPALDGLGAEGKGGVGICPNVRLYVWHSLKGTEERRW